MFGRFLYEGGLIKKKFEENGFVPDDIYRIKAYMNDIRDGILYYGIIGSGNKRVLFGWKRLLNVIDTYELYKESEAVIEAFNTFYEELPDEMLKGGSRTESCMIVLYRLSTGELEGCTDFDRMCWNEYYNIAIGGCNDMSFRGFTDYVIAKYEPVVYKNPAAFKHFVPGLLEDKLYKQVKKFNLKRVPRTDRLIALHYSDCFAKYIWEFYHNLENNNSRDSVRI